MTAALPRVLSVLLGVLMLAACVPSQMVKPTRDGDNLSRPESDQPATTPARKNSGIHVELGSAYLEGGRTGIALDEARLAIGLDPTYATAHMLLAEVYASLLQNESAHRAYEDALALAPGDPQINSSYGWFLCTQNRVAAGLERMQSAARNPYYKTPTRPLTNAGLCYLRQGNDDEAFVQFVRAYEFDASNRLALFQMAAISFRKGQNERAKQYLLQLQNIMKPVTAEVLWLALRVERKLGNRSAETDYAFRLRRDFASTEEYQLMLQGRFE